MAVAPPALVSTVGIPSLARPGFLRSPPFAILAFGAVLVVVGLVLTRRDWLTQGAIAITFAIAATALALALGLAGEYLLGISFIFAAGAYPTAVLWIVFGWSYWAAVIVGIAAGGIVGLLLSLPGLRISNFYFGMLGFFLVLLVPIMTEVFREWTGGSNGLAAFQPIDLLGLTLNDNSKFVICALMLVLVLLLVHNVRESPFGTQMRRMRESRPALASTGTSVWRVRFSAYLITSLLAGLGGALYCMVSGFVSPISFGFAQTMVILAAVIVGGSTTLFGPCIGIIVLWVVPRLVFNVEGWTDIIYGVVVLLSVLLFRGGVVRFAADVWTSLRSRRTQRAAVADTSPVAVDPAATGELAEILLELRRDSAEHELSAMGVRKRYGAVQALDFAAEERIAVQTGSIHLLLGANGSGKTTLLNALSGMLRVDGGTIAFDGRSLTGHSASAIAREGVSRSFQGPALPDETTPLELFTAAICGIRRVGTGHWLLGSPRATRVRREARELAAKIALAAGLADAATAGCAALTSGQRRMVDTVLALLSESRVVLLDEPAAGLSDAERKRFASLLTGLAAGGIGFIIVEHDLELALSLADEVTVMSAGRPIVHGTPAEIQASDIAKNALLGRQA